MKRKFFALMGVLTFLACLLLSQTFSLAQDGNLLPSVPGKKIVPPSRTLRDTPVIPVKTPTWQKQSDVGPNPDKCPPMKDGDEPGDWRGGQCTYPKAPDGPQACKDITGPDGEPCRIIGDDANNCRCGGKSEDDDKDTDKDKEPPTDTTPAPAETTTPFF